MPTYGHSNPGSGFGGPRYPGTFLLALREAFTRLKWEALAWKGSFVKCADEAGVSRQVGLDNMYRRLRREPREKWPDLIADLLGSVTPEAVTPPSNLSEVAAQLLVRLGPPSAYQGSGVDVWSYPVVEKHLSACLVIDYPASMSYVTEKMIADSGKDGAYWYQRALDNLSAKSEAGCLVQVHEESGLLQSLVADAYDSSRGLLLDRLAPGHEDNGFYVIVPGRDHLLVLPITATTLMMAPSLRGIAGKTFQETPYPISPELFWVHQSVWHHFAFETAGDAVMVKPPIAFVDVMKRLQPCDEDGSEPLSD
jgi:hypothetical protein